MNARAAALAALVGIAVLLSACRAAHVDVREARWLEHGSRKANLAVALNVARVRADPVWGPVSERALARTHTPMVAALATAVEIDAVAVVNGNGDFDAWTAVMHGLAAGAPSPDALDGRVDAPRALPSGVVEYPPIAGAQMTLFVLPRGTWATCGAPADPLRAALTSSSSPPLHPAMRSDHVFEFFVEGAALHALVRRSTHADVLDKLESIDGSISTGARAELSARLHYGESLAAASAQAALARSFVLDPAPTRVDRDGRDVTIVRTISPRTWDRLVTMAIALVPSPRPRAVPSYQAQCPNGQRLNVDGHCAPESS
jgi:hypothetical protein